MPREQNVTRRLKAILSADVKGYSLLMAEDEVFTIKTLKGHKSIMSTSIEEHGGRLVDAVGDNLLAEFNSAVDAVQCAVAVQKRLEDQNKELPEDKKMKFRIGINVADVIEDEDRIFGEGVNVASRIENLADAGGICLSSSTYDQVKNKLGLGFDYFGEHRVKNIKEPVRVYKIVMAPAPGDESTTPKSLGRPDKPSIAVLPFKNMSGDPAQDFFSDGFTEDIITTLARIQSMFVVARESSFIFKGRSVKIQEIGRDLGVRYVLEGSIQKFGDQVRITAQLIDAQNDHHLWAGKYDRELKDIFAMRDEITIKIAAALQVKLTEGEAANWGPETKSMEAYIKVMQSLEHFKAFSPHGNLLARHKAKGALDLDPNYSLATEMVAWTLLMDVGFGTSKTPEKSIEQALELAQRVLDRGDSDAGAHFLMGYAHSLKGQFDRAISELELARDLFPNNADINAGLGMILNAAGKPEQAINVLKQAMRLNPIPPGWYMAWLGDAYRLTDQHEKAVLEFKKAIQLQPDDMFSHLHLALCYAGLGRLADARDQAEQVLRIEPKFSAKNYARHKVLKNQAHKKRLIEGMRKAGLPD